MLFFNDIIFHTGRVLRMEEKVLNLLEKMYGEFSEFRQEINTKVDNLEGRFDNLEARFDNLGDKVNKNTILLERMDNKFKLIAEIQQNNFEINERQHEEINKVHKEQISLLKSALKHVIHTHNA